VEIVVTVAETEVVEIEAVETEVEEIVVEGQEINKNK
jgi:hypothetical protein